MTSKRVACWSVAELTESYRPGSRGDGWLWRDEFAEVWGETHRSTTLALLDSMLSEGQREPIILGDDGRVWDGHHRVAVAAALGRLITVTWAVNQKDDHDEISGEG